MNKDNPLLLFETVYSMGEINVREIERFSNIMPIGFTDISLWIENRNYAKHKESLKTWLKQWGIDNTEGFIDITHCLGLNDTLWVKPYDSSLHWNEVSLYSNNFSDVMEKTAFGNGLNGIEISSTDLTSPEFVSPGSFAKCWRREKDGIYLYKTKGTLGQGLEPYSEYFASQIAEHMNINSVKYELTMFNDHLCTKCKMFTSEKIGLIPFAGVFNISQKNYNISSIVEECEQLGFGQKIREMYMLDSIILNQDRHLGNLGFLFDNDTFKILDVSPIYDFNLSMLCHALPEDMSSIFSIDKYLDTNQIGHKTSDSSFFDVAVNLEVPAPTDISFHQHEKYRLDEERFAKLQQYIQLNHERILHNNKNLKREYYYTSPSIVDCINELECHFDNDAIHITVTRDNLLNIAYFKNYIYMYGLGENEIIIISAHKNGHIDIVLKDSLGESDIGDEIIGDKQQLIKYAASILSTETRYASRISL